MSCTRNWIPTLNSSETKGLNFTIMSFNVLAQSLIRREHFPYCTEEALKWKYRRTNLLKEISSIGCDIVCLQECDSHFFVTFWRPNMEKLGYHGEFKSKVKGTNGCATFFKINRFSLLEMKELEYRKMMDEVEGIEKEELDRSNIGLILVLNILGSEELKLKTLVISNTHLFWNPKYSWARLKQSYMFIQETFEISKKYKTTAIMAGDFNATPNSAVYHFLTKRNLPREQMLKLLTPLDHYDPDINNLFKVVEQSMGSLPPNYREPKLEQDFIRLSDAEELLKRSQNVPLLVSAYKDYTSLDKTIIPSPIWNGEPPYTSISKWSGTLDYLFTFLDCSFLQCVSVLEIPSEKLLFSQTGLPNNQFSSDHISIAAQYHLHSELN